VENTGEGGGQKDRGKGGRNASTSGGTLTVLYHEIKKKTEKVRGGVVSALSLGSRAGVSQPRACYREEYQRAQGGSVNKVKSSFAEWGGGKGKKLRRESVSGCKKGGGESMGEKVLDTNRGKSSPNQVGGEGSALEETAAKEWCSKS